MDIFSEAVLGDGLAQGLVHDLYLRGTVKRCTNSCHTLISDGRDHNETTAQGTEKGREKRERREMRRTSFTLYDFCVLVY